MKNVQKCSQQPILAKLSNKAQDKRARLAGNQQGNMYNKTRGPSLQTANSANLTNLTNVANSPNSSTSSKAMHVTKQEGPLCETANISYTVNVIGMVGLSKVMGVKIENRSVRNKWQNLSSFLQCL